VCFDYDLIVERREFLFRQEGFVRDHNRNSLAKAPNQSEAVGLENNDPDASRFSDPVFHCGRMLASLAELPAKTVKRDPDKLRRLSSTLTLPRH
jgi:hypothetical protein